MGGVVAVAFGQHEMTDGEPDESVDPFADFGGWGYRVRPGSRTGFVVRKGEALEVERGDGTAWVVTVDDAAEGAALLNTLADRDRR